MISAIDYWFSAKICQNVNDKVLIRQPKISYTIVNVGVIRSTPPGNALFADYIKKSVNILKNSQINKQNAHNEKSSERVFFIKTCGTLLHRQPYPHFTSTPIGP